MVSVQSEPISGVVPPDVDKLIMQIWPSISRFYPGRLMGSFLGAFSSWPATGGWPARCLRAVVIMMVLPIASPIAILLYGINRFCRYTITTRRIIVHHGLKDMAESQSLSWEELDEVRVKTLSGQAYYKTANLELLQGDQVRLVLSGVPRPETFRNNILKARDAYMKVMPSYRVASSEDSQ